MTAGSLPPGGFVDRGPLGHSDTRVQVLIVDEEPSFRRSIHRLLTQEFDVHVSEADDGVTALDHVLTGTIDLVMLGVSPGVSTRLVPPLDTLEALRRSRTYARVPVVLLAGAPDDPNVRRAVALGVDAVMSRPITVDAIRTRLGPLIAARQAERALVPRRLPHPVDLAVTHRALVVDTDAGFRAVIGRHLRALCVVEEVENEFAALRSAQGRPPDIMVVGLTSELSTPEAFVARLRRVPGLAATKLIGAVPRADLATALTSQLYDGVIIRDVDDQGVEVGLQFAFSDDTLARLLLHPSSALVMDLFDRTASALRRLLMKDVSSHPRPVRPLADPQWIVATIEFECSRLLWDLRMRCPVPLGLELVGRRLHVEPDRLTPTEVVGIIGVFFGEQWTQLQASLRERGLASRAETPDVSVLGSEGSHAPVDRATGARRWLVSATGTLVVEIGPGRAVSRENG